MSKRCWETVDVHHDAIRVNISLDIMVVCVHCCDDWKVIVLGPRDTLLEL